MKFVRGYTDDDCLRCCVATIMGWEYRDTPYVRAESVSNQEFWAYWNLAMVTKGYMIQWWNGADVAMNADRTAPLKSAYDGLPTEGLWIALVSILPYPKRHLHHAVVMEDEKLLYDPNSGWRRVRRPTKIYHGITLEPCDDALAPLVEDG